MTRDRQKAALDRLRQRGNHLAPVMVDGKVRPKGSTQPATAGAVAARESIRTPSPAPSPHPELLDAGESAFQLLIPAPAEWLNENLRLNRYEKARRVKAWRHAAAMHARRAALPAGFGRVRIDAYVIKPVQNNSDPANWAPTSKATTDGLIDYGLCIDDNRKHVEGPFMHDGGKGEPALRLVITPLPANVTAA